LSEIVTAERWLYSKLGADTALLALCPGGVHTWPVPAGVALPYVLYQMQSAFDVRGTGPTRIGISGVWLVRVVGETLSFGGNLQSAADRIDALLQAKASAVTGGNVWACVRVQPFELVETGSSGRQFRHLGGMYRLWAQ
jgi:hypothetical protein